MSDTKKNESETPAPAQPDVAQKQSTSHEETLQQARKFLQDAQVQHTTPERKAEFLKSKGLLDSDIDVLLKEGTKDERPDPQPSKQSTEERIEPPTLSKKEDRPPIVTYPEFLAKPVRPPPLVTVNGFLNTLYAFGGLSAVVYGVSKYVVEPMVDRLTEARISLHDTANEDLARLVSKLESTVSELPPARPKDSKTSAAEPHKDDDAASSYDDPTELFHRDIGVQTSLPTSPDLTLQQNNNNNNNETPTASQTRRITGLVRSLKSLSEGLTEQAEAQGDVQTVLGALGRDLEQLGSAAAATDFVGGFSLYGAAGKNEPDDEIKRAKENIRRVKGVLLSTRSFPGAAVAGGGR